MSVFKTINKKTILNKHDIILIQFIHYGFINKISLSNAELNCISLLADAKEYDLSDFCEYIVDKEIFSSTQTVRNSIIKMEKLGLVVKFGKSKKRSIKINPDLNIQTEGNIYLNLNIYHVDTKKS